MQRNFVGLFAGRDMQISSLLAIDIDLHMYMRTLVVYQSYEIRNASNPRILPYTHFRVYSSYIMR